MTQTPFFVNINKIIPSNVINNLVISRNCMNLNNSVEYSRSYVYSPRYFFSNFHSYEPRTLKSPTKSAST